uniref:Formin binding protein 1b n=1 Tax=Sphaeramia orbicularis TaxID=375764 RepID=A0A673C2I2_9TELE
MSWGSELWDQFDNLEKHTQWGIEFVEKYTKFVKERSEIEINYAKQIRNLSKKYQPKKNSREEEESKYTFCRAFLTTLNELNDYAGQHEVIAENLTAQIISELSRYLQELKSERKSHFHDGRKAQQHIESSWKQLESCKRRFERDCKEADRAQQYFEKMDADINVTKADVEKARQQAQMRHQMAADSKGDYSSYLQKFNQEQNEHYYTIIPNIFQKLQDMEEKRIERLGVCMKTFADVDRQVLPIVGKCLDGMTKASESIEPKSVSRHVQMLYVLTATWDILLTQPWCPSQPTPCLLGFNLSSKCVGELLPFGGLYIRKNRLPGNQDFSHLPPEQRRKKLQGKIDELNKDIQKEMDQRDALTKMKDVYVKNPQMGDPASVDPRLSEIGQNIEKLQFEVQKFEGWLAEVEERMPSKSDTHRRSGVYETQNSTTVSNNCAQDRESPDGSYTEEQNSETQVKANPNPTPPTNPTCSVPAGHNEGTISVVEGELLYVIEEDKGDGWTRVRRNEDEEGYVPTSYIEVFLETNAKGAMTYI